MWSIWEILTHGLLTPGCNPSIWETKAEGLQIKGWPRQHSEFNTSLIYFTRLFQNKVTGVNSRNILPQRQA
jgi:hypothetical protein